MGERIGESEMEELVPQWRWRRNKGSWFQRQGQALWRIDQLFLDSMMSVAEKG